MGQVLKAWSGMRKYQNEPVSIGFMERRGIEPLTPTMPLWCSPS